MTSLASLPTSLFSVDSPAERSRRERQALTESMLLDVSYCQDASERRGLQQEVMLLNLGLADSIAARYLGRGVDRDDLVQVARVGLLKAVLGYRTGTGSGFAAYASPTIAGEIKRYFRDYVWMVRPPRRLQELHCELRLVEPALREQLHGAPSAVDLARALCVEPAELAEALAAGRGYCAVSLDVPIDVHSGQCLGDVLPDNSDQYTAVERAEWLRPALARLTDRERRVVELRFVEDLSQQEMAHRLGVSQKHVSRLLAGVLAALRDNLEVPDASATA